MVNGMSAEVFSASTSCSAVVPRVQRWRLRERARRAAGAAFRRLVEMLEFSQGGLEGAIAGGAAARTIGTGSGWLRAKAATAGVLPNRSVVPGVTGGLLLEGEARTAAGDYLGVR